MSTRRADGLRLVADIGGTHARFALVETGSRRLLEYKELITAQYTALAPAIEAYLAHSKLPAPRDAAVAIANPVTGDRIQMTNANWSFSQRATQKRLGLRRLLVLNDFAALALSLPSLRRGELKKIGGGHAVKGAPRGLIGPGTGLGMSALIGVGAGWLAVPGEGGHVTAAASNNLEAEVIAFLRTRFDHVSAERLVSGPGLVNLYHALCHIQGLKAQDFTAQQISLEGQKTRGAPQCRAAIKMFCALLGSLAGDLALTIGARGGVYIGGGIVPALGSAFDAVGFRERFCAKGRMSQLNIATPTYLVAAPHAALMGDLQALDQAG